jgi:hypothetical protein
MSPGGGIGGAPLAGPGPAAAAAAGAGLGQGAAAVAAGVAGLKLGPGAAPGPESPASLGSPAVPFGLGPCGLATSRWESMWESMAASDRQLGGRSGDSNAQTDSWAAAAAVGGIPTPKKKATGKELCSSHGNGHGHGNGDGAEAAQGAGPRESGGTPGGEKNSFGGFEVGLSPLLPRPNP